MTRRVNLTLMASLSAALLSGCRSDMQDQPRYKPLQPSRFFADGRSARPLSEGTVARGHLRSDQLLYAGRIDAKALNQNVNTVPQVAAAASGEAPSTFDPGYATEFPFPVTAELVQKGRERFEIFCTPCHDYTGSGRGMIVQRGLSAPPSFHTERLRNAPVGHLFDVITNGYGAMYSYASRVPVQDRWAIVAYIRALQLSQNATVEDVPPEHRAALDAPAAPAPTTGGGQIQRKSPPTIEQRPRDLKPEGAR